MKKIILSILGADHYLLPGKGGGGLGGMLEDFGCVKRGFTPGLLLVEFATCSLLRFRIRCLC